MGINESANTQTRVHFIIYYISLVLLRPGALQPQTPAEGGGGGVFPRQHTATLCQITIAQPFKVRRSARHEARPFVDESVKPFE